MASDRRMFSKRIIQSQLFLEMPASTQALYFHLGLEADDDGIVDAWKVMRLVEGKPDEVKELARKGFIRPLEGNIVFISDWHEHNKLRADRKTDSIHQHLLVRLLPDVEVKQAKPRADTGKKTRSSSGRPVDGVVQCSAIKGNAVKAIDDPKVLHFQKYIYDIIKPIFNINDLMPNLDAYVSSQLIKDNIDILSEKIIDEFFEKYRGKIKRQFFTGKFYDFSDYIANIRVDRTTAATPPPVDVTQYARKISPERAAEIKREYEELHAQRARERGEIV